MPDAPATTQTLTDPLDPARAATHHATLDRLDDPPKAGDSLPPFWHQIYFWDPQPPGQLGPDGHPKTGIGLIPDLGLPQRMWAGGRLQFHAPLILGQTAEKTSSVETVTEKQGRTGRLGFVTLRHDIRQRGQLKITEHQDLVYREPPQSRTAIAPPQARTDETDAAEARFTPTQLFRYSALTFNGHRIHYDADYARDTEGYAGLVVHGPLLAQLLIHLAQAHLGPLKSFDFRATSALTVDEPATLCWHDDQTLWVRAPDGRQCMTATAT
ncbi:MAG: MaoC family dehydratase N-terminal domain-containing protein [Rhodobacter sp.]|nr:MaoC family dehydratase N-terminal domain-containing protein [Rhodobacter sp.]